MEALSVFHFARPLWLLALLPAAALWLSERRGSDEMRRWRRVIDPELLQHLVVGAERRARITPADGLLIAWALAAVAVAGPAWQREPSPFADAKPPVAVVLKVGPSMLTEDLAPTRLDRARQKLSDILAAREGASTALIAYAGSSHIVVPPTPDAAVVLDLAKALSPEIMPKRDGEDLVGALALANRTLAASANGGSVLLMADVVAPEALARLPKGKFAAITILSLQPDGASPGGIEEAGRSLGAAIVATTPDQDDVSTIARRLDRTDLAAAIIADGEVQYWKEAGYWLTPLLALLVLLWFRRGWVLA
ncbi:VWA domain-containing protein [Bosea caraganae]|uniref:VWA domain-containing protein n=2 Tax=Bosea caraganae TaxID=2763117 RepID=A0A370KXF5_9HYPH|nr:VWA domain-containing protein [Bosea caraganae]RDJ23830.1 VWA domain-containing protein [Bosea caraganae]